MFNLAISKLNLLKSIKIGKCSNFFGDAQFRQMRNIFFEFVKQIKYPDSGIYEVILITWARHAYLS